MFTTYSTTYTTCGCNRSRCKYKFYPGNTYAFDSCSDSEVYTVNDEGKLVEVNIIEEPGFMEAFKKAVRKSAEWEDDWNKKHKNEE